MSEVKTGSVEPTEQLLESKDCAVRALLSAG